MSLCGGEGVEKDVTEGSYWLCKAAGEGHRPAQEMCRKLNAKWK